MLRVCLHRRIASSAARVPLETRRTAPLCVGLAPLLTGLLRPATLLTRIPQRYCSPPRSSARRCMGTPAFSANSDSRFARVYVRFSPGFQAPGGACQRVKSSRRTRRRHIRTRSAPRDGRVFAHQYFARKQHKAQLSRPTWPSSLTHTCVSRAKVGMRRPRPSTVNAHAVLRVSFVSCYCFRNCYS